MKKILIAGPYIGELGFEVGNWVPYLKNRVDSINCDEVHIFTRAGYEDLYPFATHFEVFNFPFNSHPDQNWMINPSPEEKEGFNVLMRRITSYMTSIKSQGRVISEISDASIRRTRFANRVPVSLESTPEKLDLWRRQLPEKIKILLSCRLYKRGKSKNTDVNCMRMLGEMFIEKSLHPIYVGKTDSDYKIPDLPGTNLINRTTINDVIAVLNLSSMAMGSSSGVLHLASACNVPHVVWADWKGLTEEVSSRYFTEWNLNRTKVKYLSSQEKIDTGTIFTHIKEMLQTVLI